MDDRLKALYEAELHHLETHAAEFVSRSRYASVAERLGLSEDAQLRDPFVDWLLDGSAFLAARIQHLIASEFPRFTNAMLSIVYPHLAAPTPSMIVAQFGFDQAGTVALSGPTVPQGTSLQMRTMGRKGMERRADVMRVQFVTGRSLRLWPVKVAAAEFLPDTASVSTVFGDDGGDAACGVTMKLALTCEGSFSDTSLDTMDLFIGGSTTITPLLFEAIALSGAEASIVVGAERRRGTRKVIPLKIEPLGFDQETMVEGVGTEREALFPNDARSFDGYRMLHEFFSLPERFSFVRLSGFNSALMGLKEREITIVFRFTRKFDALTGRVGPEMLRPNCVPAVNLFEKSADNIDFDPKLAEHHVIPDKNDPTAYEVHSVRSVVGRTEGGKRINFRPFFATESLGAADSRGGRFFAVDRRPRRTPRTLADDPLLKDYRGGEIFLSLVDEQSLPFRGDLRSLIVETRCTNRHLPLYRRTGDIELTSSDDLGCDWINVAAGPSQPRAGLTEGRRQWDVISHLSLNHLSLMDEQDETGGEQAAAAMRQLLRLYAPSAAGATAVRIIERLNRIDVKTVTGRITPAGGSGSTMVPVTFGRGLEIGVSFDEQEPYAALAAAVLDRFFAGYASANSFTRTVLRDSSGEVRIEWPTRAGLRMTL